MDTRAGGHRSVESWQNGVKGAHPHIAAIAVANELHHPFLHFAGGFVGKGERQDIKGVNTFFNQVGHPVGEGTRFARAGPGNDHYRAFYLHNSLLLCFVEFVEKF